MRKILTASKDTTIYKVYPTNNAGLDEILEIGKLVRTDEIEPSYVSASARTLMYFDLPTTESAPNTANYYLNLKLANATNVHRNQKILIYTVSQSWDEGSGYFYQNIKNVNDGTTWQQANTFTSWSLAGGDYLIGATSASVPLTTYPIQDLRIDVTNIIRPIVSQSLQGSFYGFVLQFPISDENDENNKGNIKLFSTQTHTIHQPTLEVAWDSQTFSTGNLQPIPSNLTVKISTTNLPETYERGDVTKVTLNVRDPYPLKSFDSTLRYKNKYYLPSSSYYSIIDTQANTTIIPFDNFSKVDCDANGSYITLDTTPLYSGRFYSIKLKITSGSFSKTIDPNIQFSIL